MLSATASSFGVTGVGPAARRRSRSRNVSHCRCCSPQQHQLGPDWPQTAGAANALSAAPNGSHAAWLAAQALVPTTRVQIGVPHGAVEEVYGFAAA